MRRSTVHRGKLGLAMVFAATALVAAAPASGQKYVNGSDGSGDPFFPKAGNGGYDVRHYKLKLDYRQPVNVLSGRATIRAKATQNLRRFNLDLRTFYDVTKVTVNGKRAKFSHVDEHELVITPRGKLKSGSSFRVRVVYSGQPEPIVDPDESIEGWIPTDDGAFVVNEPQGSPGWYPVNDTPRDKATYEFAVKVPAGKVVMANGELVGDPVTRRGKTTWRWA
jgi:aminopeptidase N